MIVHDDVESEPALTPSKEGTLIVRQVLLSFPVQFCTFSVLINPLAHSPMLFLHYICCSYYQDTAVVNSKWARCLMHAKRRVALHPLLLFCMLSSDTMATPCRIPQSLWERRVGKLQVFGASTWSKNLVWFYHRTKHSSQEWGWVEAGGSIQGFFKQFWTCSWGHTDHLDNIHTHAYIQIRAAVTVGEWRSKVGGKVENVDRARVLCCCLWFWKYCILVPLKDNDSLLSNELVC